MHECGHGQPVRTGRLTGFGFVLAFSRECRIRLSQHTPITFDQRNWAKYAAPFVVDTVDDYAPWRRATAATFCAGSDTAAARLRLRVSAALYVAEGQRQACSGYRRGKRPSSAPLLNSPSSTAHDLEQHRAAQPWLAMSLAIGRRCFRRLHRQPLARHGSASRFHGAAQLRHS